MAGNGPKWLEMVQHGWKLPKMDKSDKNVWKWPKWLEMAQNDWKCSKIDKSDQNCWK